MSMTEEQKNCPYCHNLDGHGTDLFECNVREADARIELDDIADQIQKSIPVGSYIVLVVPPQNLNSDQMTEKILDSLPTGTKVCKITG